MNIITRIRQGKSKCWHEGTYVGTMAPVVASPFGPVVAWRAWSPAGDLLGVAKSKDQAWGFLLLDQDKRESALVGPY